MNKSEYQARIPPWCIYPTVQMHTDYIMLCWGLAGDLLNRPGNECHKACDIAIVSQRLRRLQYKYVCKIRPKFWPGWMR